MLEMSSLVHENKIILEFWNFDFFQKFKLKISFSMDKGGQFFLKKKNLLK